MNKQRRDQIFILKQELENIIKQLENIRDIEQDVFDNMPENLQGGTRGMDSEDAVSSLEEAVEKIDEAVSSLSEI